MNPLRQLSQRYPNVALNAYWLGVSFMWNSLHPIVLPVLLLAFIPEGAKNTAYGLLTFVGLMVALVTQPISGTLSDRTRSRWGRRRPWIVLGVALDLGCLALLAFARNYWTVAAGYLLLQFSSNLAHGPAQGLLPDLTPANRRGAAAGVKNLFDMAGIILASRVAGRLMGRLDPRSPAAIGVIAALLTATTLVTVLGVREAPVAGRNVFKLRAGALARRLRDVFRVDVRAHRDYIRLLAVRYCLLLGTYAVQSFALYYFRDALGVASPARVMGNMMTAIGLAITVAVYPAGVLSERWGRKRLTIVACGLVGLGMALLVVMPNMAALWARGAVIGLGMGVFASVNWAWATDLAPAAEAGKYLGLSNLATAGAAASSRLLGPVIDLINAHAANVGYSAVFVLAALSALLALALTLGIHAPTAPVGQRRPRLAAPVIEA